MRRLLFLLMICVALSGLAQTWMTDTVLGDGYQMRYVDQGRDYSGDVRSTIVRKMSECARGRAVLYVHGYNDYFFQKEMGDQFVDSCYDFYAVDLRKYGRSLMPGQTRFQVRDLSEYFADIDSAMAQMRHDGIHEVVLMGHSTGGLITSLYMMEHPDPMVRALVLNSPFLEWNMSPFMRNVLIPAVGCLGSHFPNIKLSNGNSTAYAESLLSDHHGEWQFNTDWKTFYPQKVSAGWLHAIDEGHARLRNGGFIKVPVLLMHSDKTIYGDKWTPEHQHGDAVLDVKHISKYGRQLGPSVHEVTIDDGLHDLMLSAPAVREAAADSVFNWLSEKIF